VLLTGGNRHDVTQLKPLLDAVPPIRGRVGRPRRKPRVLVADRGYDFDKYRRLLRARGIRPMIARRGVGARLGAGSLAVDGWSAPWPGCTSIGGCGSGGNVALTSMRASSSWPCV
jgi:IS5 family transposase